MENINTRQLCKWLNKSENTEWINKKECLSTLENNDINNSEDIINELIGKAKSLLIYRTENIIKNAKLAKAINNYRINLLQGLDNYCAIGKTHEELEIKVEDLACDFMRFLNQIVETLQDNTNNK